MLRIQEAGNVLQKQEVRESVVSKQVMAGDYNNGLSYFALQSMIYDDC